MFSLVFWFGKPWAINVLHWLHWKAIKSEQVPHSGISSNISLTVDENIFGSSVFHFSRSRSRGSSFTREACGQPWMWCLLHVLGLAWGLLSAGLAWNASPGHPGSFFLLAMRTSSGSSLRCLSASPSLSGWVQRPTEDNNFSHLCWWTCTFESHLSSLS